VIGRGVRRRLDRLAGTDPVGNGFVRRAAGRPVLSALLVAGSGVGVGWALAGPVAALLVGAGAAMGLRAWLGRLAAVAAGRVRVSTLDAVAALAADLRAGIPRETALTGARDGLGTAEAARLVAVTAEVGERLGAPLADLLDRIEADLRAAERRRAEVAAQTAGARATTWLLAGLPVAGLALGYTIGGDPLDVLLHTPLGAVCAVAALALQAGGLGWTGWLCRHAVEETA
jgi:tight adherence protein B